jgi:hypothetical protein
MRHRAMIVAWLNILLLSPIVVGQNAPPTGTAAVNGRIDVLLKQWSERTRSIKSMVTAFTRTEKDATFGTEITRPGYAYYVHPNLARVDVLEPADPNKPRPKNPESEETFLLTERVDAEGRKRVEVWEYRPKDFRLTINELNEQQQQIDIAEDGPLPFLFGARPDIAHARYHFEILEETEETVRVRVTPKLEEDKANFQVAELTLSKENFLPKKLVLRETRDSVVTYLFPKGFKTDIVLSKKDYFTPWEPSPNDKRWKVVRRRAVGAERPRMATRPEKGNR